MSSLETFVRAFREAAPYVHAHRGKTAVIAFGGEAFTDPAELTILVNDIAVLHALGLRMVLVHGARPQVNARLGKSSADDPGDSAHRVTDEATLAALKDAVGALRIDLEGLLSMGMANSPMANARLRVAAGNFVSARPMGVVDGVDYQRTGLVRRVDAEGIRQRLDSGAIVLLSPIGYAVTGGAYNLRFADVAAAAAAELEADKLILLVEGQNPLDVLPPQLALDRIDGALPTDLEPGLAANVAVCMDALRSGVKRAHLVPRSGDGALLTELFSRDGAGAMITASTYEDLRRAEARDVGGLLRLIRPLADAGNLVERPRRLLERKIQDF
ncbi:MAG: amino-acid N-acetyltransferase, partial [Myxococcota bacterium]